MSLSSLNLRYASCLKVMSAPFVRVGERASRLRRAPLNRSSLTRSPTPPPPHALSSRTPPSSSLKWSHQYGSRCPRATLRGTKRSSPPIKPSSTGLRRPDHRTACPRTRQTSTMSRRRCWRPSIRTLFVSRAFTLTRRARLSLRDFQQNASQPLQLNPPTSLAMPSLLISLSPSLKKTVQNFLGLASDPPAFKSKRSPYGQLSYRSTAGRSVFRIETGFVAQMGDVTRGDGSGGESIC